LDLDGTSVTDSGLMHLANLTTLQMIDLEGTRIQGDGLRALRGNEQLAWIILDNTSIDDEALQYLAAFPALENVRLRNVRGISDAGLIHLRGLRACEVLDFTGTPIRGSGLAHLIPATSLVNLKLSDTKSTTKGCGMSERWYPCTNWMPIGRTLPIRACSGSRR
jgi:hypothetical protein